MNGEWNEIKIVIPVEAIEAASSILYGMNVKGLSIEDPNDILMRESGPLTWDFADINIFKEGKDAATVTAYFPDTDNIEEHIEYIRAKIEELKTFGINIENYRVESKEVREEDWANSWKKYYKPMKIGERVVIKPIWEDYKVKNDEVVVEMDPGMAFGTGTHETTKMCIEIIQQYMKVGDRVFDIGTGSGILGITAAKLGAKEVIAGDLDPVAVDSAKINRDFNNLTNMDVKLGNMAEVVEGKANFVIANIIADVIILILEDIEKILEPGGIFVGSGIINHMQQKVLDKMAEKSMEIIEIKNENDWRAIVCKMPIK